MEKHIIMLTEHNNGLFLVKNAYSYVPNCRGWTNKMGQKTVNRGGCNKKGGLENFPKKGQKGHQNEGILQNFLNTLPRKS